MAEKVIIAPRGDGRLTSGSIGLGHIIFFVIAAAAPLTAVVGASPPAFAFGNGAGVPGAYLLAGILYLIFSTGFTAMSRHVGTTGGFYVYIAQGLGRPAGIGGALIAILTYTSIQVAVLALAGVFLSDILTPFGIVLPWWLYADSVLILSVLAGRRDIAFSGNVLGACMVGEIAILLMLDISILLHGGGPEGVTFDNFAPSRVFASGLGVAMVFVIGSFMGFEATALFAEETSEPERTIPRATYLAVLIIMLFYALTTWSITQFYGPTHVQAAAAADLDAFYFNVAEAVLGHWATITMRGLLVVSLFASCLSLHSAVSRYLFALGREHVLPHALTALHPRHASPHVAGLVQAMIAGITILVFALPGYDPYTVVFGWTSALAVLGMLAVQFMVCLAIVNFFRGRDDSPGAWVACAAPGLSAVGLAYAIWLVIKNLPLMAGVDSPVLRSFPFIIVLTGLAGAGIALWLRRQRPAHYLALGRALD